MELDSALLSVRDLSIAYDTARGRYQALRHVNLMIPRGRIVGIVGESGSGKSTLAMSLLRLLPENATITSGEIRLAGTNIIEMDAERLRDMRGHKMSMIFQDPMTSLHPALTVGAQLLDIQYRQRGLSREAKRARSVEMLEKVGIVDAADRLNSYPDEFSGGMRQRIAIGMALMNNPELLIADEPTTALDVTTEQQIVALLRRLRAEIAGSIIFISHNLGLVAELCDDLIIMYAGEIMESGNVVEVFNNPQHPYTKALLACDPGRFREKPERFPVIHGDVPDLSAVPVGCVFAGRCPYVMGKCHDTHPAPYEVTPGHHVACHLIEDIRESSGNLSAGSRPDSTEENGPRT